MRAGALIRALSAGAAAAAAPCGCCGHPMGEHRELPRNLPPETLADLANPRPNPAHRALHFHCGVDGCGCILDRTAS